MRRRVAFSLSGVFAALLTGAHVVRAQLVRVRVIDARTEAPLVEAQVTVIGDAATA